MNKDPNIITKLQSKFNESKQLNKTSISEFEEMKRYWHGDQLPYDILATLRARGQPKHWENIFQKMGNKIIGFKIATRKEIKADGRQRADKSVAALITDIFRTIKDAPSYNTEKKLCDVDLLLALGVFKVSVKETDEKDDLGKSLKEAYIEHVSGSRFFIDPYSVKLDASDAKDLHEVIFVDKSEIELYFPTKVNSLTYTTYGTRERTMVIESWYEVIENDKRIWKRTLWGGTTELLTEVSLYAHGRHHYAIRKLFIDDTPKKNDYYGFYRNIKPIQDSINFAVLRTQNMLSGNKLIMEKEAVDDADTFQEDYARDDSISMVNAGTISGQKIKEIKHGSEIAQLSSLKMGYEKSATDIGGVSDELLGSATNRLSGYAIEQRQNIGLVGLQQYMEASDELDLQAFNLVLSLIQQYYTAEQVFKIVEKDQAERYFTINEYERGEFGEVEYTNGKPKMKNKITVGRYDVTMTTIPQTHGSRNERYKLNIELMKLIAQSVPDTVKPMLPLILRDSESPIADDVMAMIQAQSQQPNPEQEQAMEMSQRRMELTLEKMAAEIKLLNAKSIKAVSEGAEEAGRVQGIG